MFEQRVNVLGVVSLESWNGKIEINGFHLEEQLFLLWKEEWEHCKWEQWLMLGVSRCFVTLKYGKGSWKVWSPSMSSTLIYFKGSLPSGGSYVIFFGFSGALQMFPLVP